MGPDGFEVELGSQSLFFSVKARALAGFLQTAISAILGFPAGIEGAGNG